MKALQWILGFFLYAISNIALLRAQSCEALFQYTQNQNQITFQNTSTYSGTGTVFRWDFGDSTILWQKNPIHIYDHPGTFPVCLNLYDSTNSCYDTYCDNILITVAQIPCTADFRYEYRNDSVFFLERANGFNLNSYMWDFGNGATSILKNPSVAFSTTSSVNVKLLISNGTCSDSISRQISLDSASICHASFNYSIKGLLVDFDNKSNYLNPSVTRKYYWDFGDSTTSHLEDSSHLYFNQQKYQVCLTLVDSGQVKSCRSTYCDSVDYIPDSASIGNCSFIPDFEVTTWGSKIYINNKSSRSGWPTAKWFLGDGNTASSWDVAHNYGHADTFLITLFLSNAQCADTAQRQVIISPVNCQANYSYSWDGAARLKFQDTSLFVGNVSYLWNFGGPGTSTDRNPTRIFSIGKYNVCLTITDSLNNCISTFCDSIDFSNSHCDADFSYFPDTVNNVVHFNNNSTALPGFYSNWSFGDNRSGMENSPAHIFPDAGSYDIQLAIHSGYCRDTIVKQVIFNGLPQLKVQGIVDMGSSIVDEAKVYLIVYDSSQGTLTAIDSTIASAMDSGRYEFDHVDLGKYLVKAALTGSSSQYANYIPTYHESALFWNTADALELMAFNSSGGPEFYADIDLRPGNNPGGPGFIGGLVSQGANKKTGPGDPLANVLVMLLDMNNKPITYDWTDANGEFAFKNIAFGQYQVWTEIPGKTTIPSMVGISSDKPERKDLQISVGETVITGIINLKSSYEPLLLEVFPNPTNDYIFIRHKSTEIGLLQITLRNNLGQVILVKELSVQPNTIHNERINIKPLSTGLYFVEVLKLNTNEAASWIQKVVVK